MITKDEIQELLRMVSSEDGVTNLSPALSQVLSQDEEKDASTDAKDAISSSKVATLDEEAADLADNGRNSVIRKQRQELHKELQ